MRDLDFECDVLEAVLLASGRDLFGNKPCACADEFTLEMCPVVALVRSEVVCTTGVAGVPCVAE